MQLRALICFALPLFLLTACGGSGTPQEEHKLAPGKTYIGVDGVAIGAVAGALTSTVDVSIDRADAPTQPLPAGTNALGNFYRIAAKQDVFAQSDSPFLIGLPVPAGQPPDSFAVAVQVPRRFLLDSTADSEWVTLPAFHDAPNKLLLVPLSALSSAGVIVVVVSAAGAPSAAVSRALAVNAMGVGNPVLFEVTCSSEFGVAGTPETCRASDLVQAATTLEANYRELVDVRGFKKPRLLRTVAFGSILPIAGAELGPYTAQLRPKSRVPDNDVGLYDWQALSIWVAIPEGGLGESEKRTLRHEYFHATQYAYTRVLADPQDGSIEWATEGQATAAQSSNNAMSRELTWNKHAVDDSLLNSDLYVRYQAQDFWVYLGARLNRGLDYLAALLEEGLTPAEVDGYLRRQLKNPEVPDLATAYWEWAKNQVYEKTIGLGGTPAARCAFDGDVATAFFIVFDPNFPAPPRQFHVQPLSSVVVRVDFNDPTSYTGLIEASSSSPSLKVKIYRRGGVDCPGEVEAKDREVEVRQGTAQTFFVLMSNTDHSGRIDDLQLRVSLSDRVVRVDPPIIRLSGAVDQQLIGTFVLSNLTDKPVSYRSLAAVEWLRPNLNASGILPPKANVVVQYTATCPSAPGSHAAEITLEFQDESGASINAPRVPTRVPVALECGADCSRFSRFTRWDGDLGLSYGDSANFGSGGSTSSASVRLSGGGSGIILRGAGAWTTSFGDISGVSMNYSATYTRLDAGRPPLKVEETAVGAVLNPPSFVALRINPFTCTYVIEFRLAVAGTATTTFGTQTTIERGGAGVEGIINDVPINVLATEVSGSVSIPTRRSSFETHLWLAGVSTHVSIPALVVDAGAPSTVTWTFKAVE